MAELSCYIHKYYRKHIPVLYKLQLNTETHQSEYRMHSDLPPNVFIHAPIVSAVEGTLNRTKSSGYLKEGKRLTFPDEYC